MIFVSLQKIWKGHFFKEWQNRPGIPGGTVSSTNTNSLNPKNQESVIFSYKFAVDIKIEKCVLLFLFRIPFRFQVPQDVVVWSIYPKVGIPPTYLYFWITKNAVILILYHNSEGCIQAYGFILFISLKPHFSGPRFDTRLKTAIRSRYPYHICKIAIFVFLSIYQYYWYCQTSI